MKFDKFMEHCFKIMCICVACVVFLGAVFSCTGATLTARAVSLSASEQAGIQDYFDAYSSGLAGISIDFSTDEDGNRTRKLEILGLQQLAFREQFKVYDNLDFNLAPDSFSMAGSCSSALYQVSGDPNYYVVNVLPVSGGKYPWIAATSQHFNLSISLSNYLAQGDFPSVTRYNVYGVNGSTSTGFWFSGSGQNRHIFMTDKSGFFQNYELQTGGCYFYISSTTIPIFSQGQRLNFTGTIGGFGSSYTLPESDVPSASPWDYYNDTLLPYIHQNYDIDDIDQYIVFPDGYNPGPTYITNNNNSVVVGPVIIGDPSIINLGGVDFDVFAPIKGQLSIDGIDFNFPQDQNDNRVFIDGQPYELPLPEITIGDHTISVDDRDTIHFDGFEFHFNADGTITINNTDYTLPVGTPSVLPSDVSNYEMYYEIPTMENINIVDSQIQSVDLSAFSDGISMFWGLIGRFYADTGLFGAMTTCLGIAAIGYAIAKLGGH